MKTVLLFLFIGIQFIYTQEKKYSIFDLPIEERTEEKWKKDSSFFIEKCNCDSIETVIFNSEIFPKIPLKITINSIDSIKKDWDDENKNNINKESILDIFLVSDSSKLKQFEEINNIKVGDFLPFEGKLLKEDETKKIYQYNLKLIYRSYLKNELCNGTFWEWSVFKLKYFYNFWFFPKAFTKILEYAFCDRKIIINKITNKIISIEYE